MALDWLQRHFRGKVLAEIEKIVVKKAGIQSE